MATGFEKLDKQLDRLEKLFSKKKKSESHDSDVPYNRPATPMPLMTGPDATAQIFPQPSFIRPTSSRMIAREEVLLTPHSARRTKSLPESPSTPRLTTSPSSGDNAKLAGSTVSDGSPTATARYSSVGPVITQRSSILVSDSQRDNPPSELFEFSFSTASKKPRDDSSAKRRSRPVSKTSSRPTSVSISPKSRIDRKRHSVVGQGKLPLPHRQDHEDWASKHGLSDSEPLQKESRCLAAVPQGCLAPPASPKLASLPESRNGDSNNSDKFLDQSRSLSTSGTHIKHASQALRKITDSSHPTVKASGSEDSLKEPSVNDFLALSDDDIADGHTGLRTQAPASSPPKVALPPKPSLTVTPVRTKPAHPLLTLSPPLASRPATAAAFEAARIAIKYQFDLVYVVNLWPSHISRPSRSSPLSQFCGTPVATSPVRNATPSPPGSPASNTSSGYDSGFESRTPVPRENPRGGGGVTGRLLAAYGLPSIMYPFRISAPVHQKVLRTQGWLEYRNETGAHDEFARGYSCSFYTGYSPARGCGGSAAASTNPARSPQNNKPANRGIVFAAFRLPREDGTLVCSDAEELEALHRDAEALVDMLIDIHMTQRQRRTPATTTTTTPRRCVAGLNGRMVRPGGAPLVAI